MIEPEIAAAQRRLSPLPSVPRTRRDYRRVARWWELEARRRGQSYLDCLRYAANMRWAAERVAETGPGTWADLKSRT